MERREGKSCSWSSNYSAWLYSRTYNIIIITIYILTAPLPLSSRTSCLILCRTHRFQDSDPFALCPEDVKYYAVRVRASVEMTDGEYKVSALARDKTYLAFLPRPLSSPPVPPRQRSGQHHLPLASLLPGLQVDDLEPGVGQELAAAPPGLTHVHVRHRDGGA